MEDGGWVWWRHKAYHPKVIANLQLRVIASCVSSTRNWDGFSKAITNPKYSERPEGGRTWDQIATDAIFNARRYVRQQKEDVRNFHLANGARTEP